MTDLPPAASRSLGWRRRLASGSSLNSRTVPEIRREGLSFTVAGPSWVSSSVEWSMRSIDPCRSGERWYVVASPLHGCRVDEER